MRALAATVGLALDQRFGEPPTRWHPVAWFGSAMGAVERRCYRDERAAGALYTAVGVSLGLAAGSALRRSLGPHASVAVAVALASAGRMLDEEASAIGALLQAGEIDGARARLRGLVGRSPEGLDEPSIARAVVESVAENTVDAVTAPLFWALVGGAPAVLAHRAINTMDAMVGHRNARYERFGWASARLDDVANWVPARLTAAVAVPWLASSADAPTTGEESTSVAGGLPLAAVRRQAAAHPSPNGGLIEAAVAYRLGITLGGTNRYGNRVEHRGVLGRGRAAAPTDITRVVQLRRRVTVELAAAALLVGLARRGFRAID